MEPEFKSLSYPCQWMSSCLVHPDTRSVCSEHRTFRPCTLGSESHSGHILTNAAGGQSHPWRNAEEDLTLGVISHLCQLQPLSLSESVSRSVMSDCLRPHGLSPARLLCPWNSEGRNTGVGCHALLQGIFPSQGSNPGLLNYRQILYCVSHQGR